MRQIKSILLLLTMLIAGSSYGQTKEETIEWFKLNGSDMATLKYESPIYDEYHVNEYRFYGRIDLTLDSLKYYLTRFSEYKKIRNGEIVTYRMDELLFTVSLQDIWYVDVDNIDFDKKKSTSAYLHRELGYSLSLIHISEPTRH